jgi:MFS transporter, PAT family, beta-lactamase induction signal transducer AmpG
MSSVARPPEETGYLRLFVDRRLAYIFALGFASGFPWAVIGNTFSFWLSSAGLTRASIGVLGSVTMIFALNFLWAPLLDRVRLPLLCTRFGQRRGWILLAQTGIVLGTGAIALVDLTLGITAVALSAAFVVFSAATQDVAIDAYRIETIPREEERKMAAGSAATAAGWWTGAGLPGACAFFVAGYTGDWTIAYQVLTVFALGLLVITLCLPEPTSDRDARQAADEARFRAALADSGKPDASARAGAWLATTVVEPFAEFFRRNGWKLALAILSFIVLFKIGEAFMGRMAAVFYSELGFSAQQVGWISGMLGWITMAGFILLSALINVRLGIFRGLLISGIAMALANLVYSWMALVGPNLYLFTFAVVVDNFTTAFSTVATVAFISFLTSKVYTATQYALMASLGNLSRTSLAAGSGFMVDWLDSWALFFFITTIMVIPSLVLLLAIRHALTRRMGAFFSRAAA